MCKKYSPPLSPKGPYPQETRNNSLVSEDYLEDLEHPVAEQQGAVRLSGCQRLELLVVLMLDPVEIHGY